MKLRKWMAEEKMAIVLKGLKGQKSIAEICTESRSALILVLMKLLFLESFALP